MTSPNNSFIIGMSMDRDYFVTRTYLFYKTHKEALQLKKTHKTIAFLLIFSILSLSLIPITKDTVTAKAAGKIYLSNTSLTLELDHYKTLRVRGTSGKVTWSSSDRKVASVSSSGKVFANAPGYATITASVGGKKLKCKVNIVYMAKNATVTKDQSSSLTIFGARGNAVYTSSDPSVVTVSAKGKLTGKKVGKATITASVDGKELTSTVSVIGMNHSSILLELGAETGFVKTLKVENASSKIKWSTSDKNIATVTSEGVVYAQGVGSAVITAEVNGRKVTSTVKVIQASAKNFTLRAGKTKDLQVHGTDNTVIWSSNNTSVATISADGKVTAVAPGNAIIFGYVDDRDVFFHITVTE